MELDVDLINIGNSKGIRLPKSIIEACGFGDSLHLEVKDDQLIISANKPARFGWRELFANKNLEQDDPDLAKLRDIENEWDNKEWTW